MRFVLFLVYVCLCLFMLVIAMVLFYPSIYLSIYLSFFLSIVTNTSSPFASAIFPLNIIAFQRIYTCCVC